MSTYWTTARTNYWTTYRRMKNEYPNVSTQKIRNLTKYDILMKKDRLTRSQRYLLRFLRIAVQPIIEKHKDRTEISVEPTITVVEPSNIPAPSDITNKPLLQVVSVVVPHKKYTKKDITHEARIIEDSDDIPAVAHIETPPVPHDVTVVVPEIEFTEEDIPGNNVLRLRG